MSSAPWSTVERTPSKPGPGPLPDQLLRALDLTVVRRVEGLLSGDHRAHVLGRGTELAQVRPYVAGEDDVRDIDWNVTARTGEPHVRVQLAERVLVSWIVLDTSVSMSSAPPSDARRTSPRGGTRARPRREPSREPARRADVRRRRASHTSRPARAGQP